MAAYVFYNPLAGNGEILEDLDALEFVLDMPCVFCDMTRPETYGEALFAMTPEDTLILCGGDGTINRFANLTRDLQRGNEILYYPAGEQNNFARDLGRHRGCNPFPVTKWLQSLPRIQMGGRAGCFLTASVFDAFGKKRRTSGEEKVYTENSVSCTVVADGVSRQYDRVWYAAVLYGRHCGGFAPDPQRVAGEPSLSLVLICGCGRHKGKLILEQLKHGRQPLSRHYVCCKAREIRLNFDRPVNLRTDGELQESVREVAVQSGEEQNL